MRRFVLTWCLGLCWLCMASSASAILTPLSNLVRAQNGANVWIEQPLRPDAGDVDAPQQIQGSNITEIDGIIGSNLVPFVTADFVCIADVAFCCPPPGFGDCADAFRFFFAGGSIQFTGFEQFDGGTPLGGVVPDITLMVPLPLQLFTDGGGSSIISPDTRGPGCVPGLPCFQIGFNNLAAGNYILRATENQLDPPYVITISTGIGTPQGSVPEPEQLSLVAAALAALFVARRRKPRFMR